MFVSIQVTASLGRPIVQWSILEVNKDSMTFADLFQAIKAGRFEVISMSDELKKTKLSKTFVGTKTDGLMATSSSQTLRVCSQFGNYIRFSVDLEEEDSVGLHAATLPNAFVIMAASQRRLQLGDTGLPFAAEVKDGRDRMYNDLLGLMREMGVKWSDPRVFGATFLKNLRDVCGISMITMTRLLQRFPQSQRCLPNSTDTTALARTILRSKVNIYGTIIGRVYGEYTITSFLGNFGACANIRYQAAFPPPRPGYEGSKSHTALEHVEPILNL